MKLREWAAIATGVLVAVATVAAQWIWTQRPIEDILFIALMAYLIGIAVYLAATEKKQPQRRRKHRARRYEPDNFKIVTLNREEWEGR